MSDRGQVPPNGDESWHSRVPPALARWGLSAWLILGTIALAVVVYFGLVQISSLLYPSSSPSSSACSSPRSWTV